MKISDAVIQLKKQQGYDKDWVIIPFFEHELCIDALKLANKKESKGIMGEKRYNDCIRVAQALERDNRFEKYIHVTGRRGFQYLDK